MHLRVTGERAGVAKFTVKISLPEASKEHALFRSC
jgi:hypothetical protein